MDDKIQCMIRLDDITPDMDWERFRQAERIFDKYKILPLIGVVPNNKDATLHKQEENERFWETIHSLQEKGWSVAQHGTCHCYETEDGGILGINPFSEFAGLPYEKQLEKLKKGKDIMEQNGVHTDIFMAPGHTYDKNTLKALAVCGFRIITDGLANTPYYMENILCIPCRLQGFKKPAGVDTICLHTNLMDCEDMEQLDKFCRENQGVIVPFDTKRWENTAKNRTWRILLEEKSVLKKRQIKDKIAHSRRLTRYLQKTNDKNAKIKWIKRIVCLPLILVYKEET